MKRATKAAGCFLLLLAFLLPGGIPVSAREYKVLDIIGDSLTIGTNPDYFAIQKSYGWVEMLLGQGGGDFPPAKDKTLYTLWPGIEVSNVSYQGAQLWQWGDSASTYTQNVLNHHPDLVLIQIGGIDITAGYMDFGHTGDFTFYEWEKENFRRNLRTLIGRLQANAPRPDVLFLGYFDAYDGLSWKLPATSETHFASESVLEGNGMLLSIAQQMGFPVVDLYSVFLHHTYGHDLFFADPLATLPIYMAMPLATRHNGHPVTAGHSAIYEAVYKHLQAMKYPPANVPSEIWSLY